MAGEECKEVSTIKAQQILTRTIAHHKDTHIFAGGKAVSNNGHCCKCPHGQPIFDFLAIVPPTLVTQVCANAT